jgi:hypothetical protein
MEIAAMKHLLTGVGVVVIILPVLGQSVLSQTPTSSATSGAATRPTAGRIHVGFAFVPSWRLGAPAFAQEVFPKASDAGDIVYLGQVVPRGLLVLRGPNTGNGTQDGTGVVVRSATVDITSHLQVIGAQYRKTGEERVEWIPAEKLPKCRVTYEPLLPKEIGFPGRQNCVLLYEIGTGAGDEWREGLWIVSLRLDLTSLNIQLEPQGSGAVADPMKPDGSAVIYQLRFSAKSANTEAAKQNVLYYTFLTRKSSDDEGMRKKAIEPLNELVKAYPTEANMLFARAQLLAADRRYGEAIEDIARIEAVLDKGEQRTVFSPLPSEEQMSKEAVISVLRGMKRSWGAMQTTEPATRSGAEPPQDTRTPASRKAS